MSASPFVLAGGVVAAALNRMEERKLAVIDAEIARREAAARERETRREERARSDAFIDDLARRAERAEVDLFVAPEQAPRPSPNPRRAAAWREGAASPDLYAPGSPERRMADLAASRGLRTRLGRRGLSGHRVQFR